MPRPDPSTLDKTVKLELRPGSNVCQCPTCDLYFTGVKPFDLHLIIGRKDTYCRTPEQMRKIGMVQNANGVWMGGTASSTGKGTGRKQKKAA